MIAAQLFNDTLTGAAKRFPAFDRFMHALGRRSQQHDFIGDTIARSLGAIEESLHLFDNRWKQILSYYTHVSLDCHDCDLGTYREYYLLHDELWDGITQDGARILCIGCAERRLGRRLEPEDFAMDAGANDPMPHDSRRLSDRRGQRDEFIEGVELRG